MDRPSFDVTSEGLRHYAALFDVAISDADVEMLRTQFTGGLASLADLRAVDLDGIEPFVAFPIDRGQP